MSRQASKFEVFKEIRTLMKRRNSKELAVFRYLLFQAHKAIVDATTEFGGHQLINFSSYRYLGLFGHPEVREKAREAIQTLRHLSFCQRLGYR